MNWMLSFVLRSKDRQRISADRWLHIFNCGKDNLTIYTGIVHLLDEVDLRSKEVIDFLARVSEDGNIVIAEGSPRFTEIAQSLLDSSDREGILVFALALAGSNASQVVELANIANLSERRFSTPAGRDAIAALQVAKGHDDIEYAALTAVEGDSVGQHAVLAVARSALITTAEMKAAVAHIATKVVDGEHVRIEAVNVLKQMLDKERSELRSRHCWVRLKLPDTLFRRIEA
ncbi:hypothetical protein A8V01_09510 [Novosphingobium guangzhouense]|uniref:Uncharacterized protein n=2 Tax=Novosphingobium guangzhouense TaxID=1850347 RepID=A0A2K2FTK8_9SPHN|nr:hypothetical protein A8V01_09510 [Novosphingobium guangzhouense]